MQLATQPAAPRWGRSLVLVLCVHVAVIALALHDPRDVPLPSPAPTEAIMVDIAPVPEAAPAERSDVAPGPLQPPREVLTDAAPDAPTPRPEPLPTLPVSPHVPTPEAMPEATPLPAGVTSSSSAQATAPPGAHEATAQRNAASEALAGTTRAAMVTWQSQVLGHLERFKQYPCAAQRRRQEGTVQVRYTVDRQGVVLDAVLATSSGRDALDEEAVAAVRRASPLPRPPAEIPGEAIDVTTPVSFRLPRS